jgi:glycerophosphoryl diester phosphodiesterase
LIELVRPSDGRLLRIGHRGAAALAPENTLHSFERAIELGVDFVEFDVLDLADGTLVLAHSDDLLEVSHGASAGSVRGRTLPALRQVAPELPTLDEALEFFTSRPVSLHVDVKCGRGSGAVARALRRHGLLGRAVASAFRRSTLRELRAVAPELALAVSYPDDCHGLARRRLLTPFVPPTVAMLARVLPPRLARWLDASGARAAMLHYAVVSPAAVERCRKRGAAVWAWTVNSPELAASLRELGVDGIVSDDPRIFLH